VRGQRHASAALYPQGKDSVPIVKEAGVGPRAGLDRFGKSRLPPTSIRSPDRPARSHSLYRLSYRGPQNKYVYEAYYLEFVFILLLTYIQLLLLWHVYCDINLRALLPAHVTVP